MFNKSVAGTGYMPMEQRMNFANEREILYKLFFDMKKDVTELKKMFLEILQNPNGVAKSGIMNELKELKAHEVMQPIFSQPYAAYRNRY